VNVNVKRGVVMADIKIKFLDGTSLEVDQADLPAIPRAGEFLDFGYHPQDTPHMQVVHVGWECRTDHETRKVYLRSIEIVVQPDPPGEDD